MAWEAEHYWYDQEQDSTLLSFINATIIKQAEKDYLIDFKNKDTAEDIKKSNYENKSKDKQWN